MTKGKDFFGKDISDVIEQACKNLCASHEELDIEVLETGSAGIFGLCKKKAHIRVQRKAAAPVEQSVVSSPARHNEVEQTLVEIADNPPPLVVVEENREAVLGEVPTDSTGKSGEKYESGEEQQETEDFVEEEILIEPPSEENIGCIQADLQQLLTLMGLPSEVQAVFEQNTVQCNISGMHEEHIVGTEGRTLDSLQYLLRKMVSRYLPDKVMLALNAGDFRERRAEELKVRAVELASQVKEDGKTQAIPALNPSERRVVHMALQDDKGVRSRSVGEGLFKKVLIYKPGKNRRPASKKRRGGQGGRPSGD